MEIREAQRYALKTLESLCRIPTVPFHEEGVVRHLYTAMSEVGLTVSLDRYGNVLATRPGRDADAPGIAFVAHTDHPGFEAVAVESGRLVADVLGGITRQALEAGVAVEVIAEGGERVPGTVVESRELDGARQVLIDVGGVDVGTFPRPVILALVDFEIDGELIRARALDDLGGCAAVAGALAYAAGRESAGTVYGLFTRAEEGGLFGARLAAEDGLLPAGTRIVSVETSHVLPGAEIGGGVVIRTGDRGTTFDDAAEAYLRVAANELAGDESLADFKVQRQLMSGGGCEASAFAAFGYSVTGTAYPLGNWHNGLMQEVVEAEYIDLNDFRSGVALLCGASDIAGTEPRGASAERMSERPEDAAERLAGRSAIGG
ncbi:MAG: M20/M25/M40 family metallo-hydrolase [Chloroflexi bacterium]|nr:M20/M25/M40 family metallo-hydrolase [Chloroflexota bacterium]